MRLPALRKSSGPSKFADITEPTSIEGTRDLWKAQRSREIGWKRHESKATDGDEQVRGGLIGTSGRLISPPLPYKYRRWPFAEVLDVGELSERINRWTLRLIVALPI